MLFAPAEGHGVLSKVSPDGMWVVFEDASANIPGREGLWYAPVDGSVPAREIGPSYSYTWRQGFSFLPDGKQVLLALEPANLEPSVLIDVDGGETIELADVTAGDRTWQRLAMP